MSETGRCSGVDVSEREDDGEAGKDRGEFLRWDVRRFRGCIRAGTYMVLGELAELLRGGVGER